jgi:effector-binding domain-containing protein
VSPVQDVRRQDPGRGGTAAYEVEEVTLHAQPTLVMRATVAQAGIGAFVGAAFERVTEVAGQDGMYVSGPPFARIHPEPDGRFRLEVGFPVSGMLLGQGDVKASHLPGGPGLRTMHRGDYARSGEAHEALGVYATQHGLTPAGDSWEVYLDGPDVAVPRTLVVLPVEGAP